MNKFLRFVLGCVLLTSVYSQSLAQTITPTSPTSNSTVNSISVSYSLAGAATSGSITYTLNGSSALADSHSPHVYNFVAGDMTTGPHTITPTLAFALVDGALYDITFTTNANNVTNTSITYAITAPAAPSTPALSSGSDSGVSNSDRITNINNGLVFTGTCQANATLNLYQGGSTLIGTATANGSGNWTVTTTTALSPDGTYSITAKAVNAAGTSGASSSLSVTTDTQAPLNQNTVFAANAFAKSSVAVTIVSSGTASNQVWFAPSGMTTFASFIAGATMTVAASGTSTSILSPSTVGTYYLYVIDAAGNVSSASTASLTVDNTAPVGFSVTSIAATAGAPLVANYWNSTNTTLSVVVPIQSSDASLVGGSLVLQIQNSGHAGFVVIHNNPSYAISLADVTAGSKTVTISSADFSATTGGSSTGFLDGTVIQIQATLTDAAGNGPTSSTLVGTLGTDEINIDVTAPGKPATPVLPGAFDSGSSNSDGVTNISAVTFTGTAVASDASLSMTVYSGVTQIGTGIATGTGSYSLSATLSTQGAQNITVTCTDAAGNVSPASTALSVTYDTQAPLNQNTVFAANAFAKSSVAVTIVSSGTASNQVWFAPSGMTTFASFIAGATMTVAASGTSTSILSPSTVGTYYLYVIDAAGNVSSASTASLTVDNTAPVGFSVTSIAATAGAPLVANYWNSTNTTLSVVVPIQSSDASLVGGSLVLQIQNSGHAGFVVIHNNPSYAISLADVTAGSKTVTISSADFSATTGGSSTGFLDGTVIQIQATLTDAAGNGPTSSTLVGTLGTDEINIDVTAPGKPATPVLPGAFDSGSSNSDGVTNISAVTFTGTAVASDASLSMTVYSGVTQIGTGIATGTGSYSLSATLSTQGAQVITVKCVDAAGNVSPASTGLPVTFDNIAPTAPNAPDLTNDSGISATDNITKNAASTFSSTGNVADNGGLTIKIYSVATQVGSGPANGAGGFTNIVGTLSTQGAQNITVTCIDLAGNESLPSPALSVTFDNVAPTVSPVQGIFNANGNSPETIQLSFSEPLGLVDGTSLTIVHPNPSASVVGFETDRSNTHIALSNGAVYSSGTNTVLLKSDADGKWCLGCGSNTINNAGYVQAGGVPCVDVAGNELTGYANNIPLSNGSVPALESSMVLFPNGTGAETIVFNIDQQLTTAGGTAFTNGTIINGLSVSTGTLAVGGAVYNYNAGAGIASITLTNSGADGTWTSATTVTYTGSGNITNTVGSMAAFAGEKIIVTAASIASNNAATNWAKSGNTVTLTFTLNKVLSTAPTATIDGAAAAIALSSGTALQPGAVYTASTSTLTNQGILAWDLTLTEANRVTDVTATLNGTTVTYDNTPPVVTPVTIASNNATNTTYAKTGDVVTVSHTVTDNLGSVTVGTPASTIALKPITTESLATTTRTMDGTEANAIIPFSITFADQAGNTTNITSVTTGPSVTFDNIAPTVQSIVPALGNNGPNGISNTATLTYTVTFAEAVTNLNLTAPGDFSLTSIPAAGATGFPLVTGTITGISGSGSVYTVTVTGVSGTGQLRLDFTANNAIIDAAGNPNVASFNSGTPYSVILPEPSNNITLLSSSSPSTTSIKLSWTNPIGTQLPTHLLVVGILHGSGAFPGSIIDGTLIAASGNWNSAGTYGAAIVDYSTGAYPTIPLTDNLTISGLLSGNQYDFRIYPYSLSPNDVSACSCSTNVDYKTTGTQSISQTVITAANTTITAGSTAAPATISSILAGSNTVLSFKINDDDGLPAADNAPTTFTGLVINKTSGGFNTIADWTTVIASAKLVDVTDGSSIAATGYGVNTITFTGIPNSLSTDIGFIPDNTLAGSTKEYQLQITLKSPFTANVDDQAFDFTFDPTNYPTSITYGPPSSTITPGQLQSTGAETIHVIATGLAFTTQPVLSPGAGNQYAFINFTTNPVVKAIDAHGNIDLDFATTLNILTPGSLTLSQATIGPDNAAPNAGVYTFPASFQFQTTGSGTLQVTGSGLDSNSGIGGSVACTPITVIYSNTSTISSGSGVATLNSITSTSTPVSIFNFTIKDDNGAGGDGANTYISTIKITQDAANQFSDWRQIIATATLTDGVNSIAGTIDPAAGAFITFSGIPTGAGQLGYILDNGTKVYTLQIKTLTTLGGTLPSTADNLKLVFDVTQVNVATTGLSSIIASGQNTNSVTTNGVYQVLATRLKFSTEPAANYLVNIILSTQPPVPVAEALDADNNRDLDFSGAVSVTSAVASPNSQPTTITNGLINNFGPMKYTTIGDGTLTVSTAVTNAIGGAVAQDISSAVLVSVGTATSISTGASPATFSSTNTSSGTAATVFTFSINDDALAPPNDGNPTLVSQIIFTQNATNNNIPNWTQAIGGAILTDGTNTQTVDFSATPAALTATSIKFSGIGYNVVAQTGLGYITDNATKSYTLKIWLKGSTKTGTINSVTSSSVVTGTGTLFSTELSVGDPLFDAGTGLYVGTVLTITSNTSLTLTANANVAVAGATYKNGLGGTLPITIDGAKFAFDILQANVTTDPNGTAIVPGQSTTSTAGNDVVTVVASKLRYITEAPAATPQVTTLDGTVTYAAGFSLVPSPAFYSAGSVNTPFNPVIGIEAVDANGNRDKNFASATANFSSTTLTTLNNPSGSFTNGTFAFPAAFQYNSGNNITPDKLTIDAGALTNQQSPNILVSFSTDSYVYFDPAFGSQDFSQIAVNTQTGALPATANTSVATLAQLILSDGGGAAYNATLAQPPALRTHTPGDLDGAATQISSLKVLITGAGLNDINQIGIYSNAGTLLSTGTIVAGTATFNGLTLSASDNSTVTFSIRNSFKTTYTDHDPITLQVTGVTWASGSQPYNYNGGAGPYFGGVDANASGGDVSPINKVDAVATKLVFTILPPAYSGINQPVPLSGSAIQVQAQDGYNVLDLDQDAAGTSPTSGTVSTPSGGAGLGISSFAFSQGILNLTGLTYNSVGNLSSVGPGNGTLTVSTTNVLGAALSVTSAQRTDVIHISTTLATGGVTSSTNLASGSVNKVIFGVTFNTPYYVTGAPGQPQLQKFRISFSNPVTNVFSAMRIFQSPNSSFGGFDVTTLPGVTVALDAADPTNKTLLVNFNGQARDLSANSSLSFFLQVDIDPTANGSTPSVQPSVADDGVYLSATYPNIVTSHGSATSSITGQKYTFAAIFPPTFVSSNPGVGQTNVDPNQSTIALTFSVPVWTLDDVLGVTLNDGLTNTVIQTLSPVNGKYSTSSGGTLLGTLGSPISFSLPALSPNHLYYITIAPGKFGGSAAAGNIGIMDQSNNLFPGISSPGTLYFKTANPNPPLMVTSSTPAPYTASSDPNISNVTLTSATINATFDQKGTAYYLVLNHNAAAPTLAQIEGAAYAGSIAQGSFPINQIAPTSQSGVIAPSSLFTTNATYDVWMAAKNDALPTPISTTAQYGSAAHIARTGTISANTGSPNVTGTGTLFTTQLKVGGTIYNASGSSVIGTIAKITDDTNLSLTANSASLITNGNYSGSGFEIGAAGPTFTFTAPSSSPAQLYLNSPSLSICTNSYQILNEPIVLVESGSMNEFSGAVGVDQTFNLVLPAGFSFDVTLSGTNPQYGTISLSSGTDFVAGSGKLSFIGNTILSVTFRNHGSASLDNITISGLRVISASAGSGSITRLGGNAFPTSAGIIGDGLPVAQISSNDASGISFTNSYSTQVFGNNSVSSIPDNYVDLNLSTSAFEVRLTPLAANGSSLFSVGDFGPSTFSGTGVNVDILSLSAPTLGTPFNITVNHTDDNGCKSTSAIQYTVYDHNTAVKIVNSVPLADNGPYCAVNDKFVNTNAPLNPINSPTHNVPSNIYTITFDNLTSYYLDSLTSAIPISATPIGAGKTTDQIIFGVAWQKLITTSFINWHSANPHLAASNNPRPGHPYYDDSFDLSTILDANSLAGKVAVTGTITATTGSPLVTGIGTLFITELNVGQIIYDAAGVNVIGTISSIASNTSLTLVANASNVITNGNYTVALPDPYSYFRSANLTAQGNYYYNGGSLGLVELTATYQSIANAAVENKIKQNIQFFVPAVPLVEVSPFPAARLDTADPLNPAGAPGTPNQGTPIFCQASGLISVNGWPAAAAGTSIGRFTLTDVISNTVIYDAQASKTPAGFVDNGNGTATLDPTKIFNSINPFSDIKITYYYNVISTTGQAQPCASSASQIIRISANPVAQFTIATANTWPTSNSTLTNSYCVTNPSQSSLDNSIKFTSTSIGSIKDQTWDFGDANSTTGNLDTAKTQNASHKFPLGTNYIISLQLVSTDNCPSAFPTAQSQQTITVGEIPIPSFKVAKNCVGEVILFDASGSKMPSVGSNSSIATYNWDYNAPPVGAAPPSPATGSGVTSSTIYSQPGFYNVQMNAITDRGCQNVTTNIISQLPTTASFLEDFEASNGQWQSLDISGAVPKPNNNSSWIWGTVNNRSHTAFNSSSNHIWSTSGNAGFYYPGEKSALYSPCLNLDPLVVPRPMISFDAFVDLLSSDGVVLQYSTDSLNILDPLKKWNVLGTTPNAPAPNSPGIDWYTYEGLASNPGGNSAGFGWYDTSSVWIHPKHKLDVVSGSANPVILRFAFSSLSANNNSDGIGIDNIRFGSRTRTILFENFVTTNASTSVSADVSADATYITTQFLPNNIGSTQLVNINYHIGFLGADPFNLTNPADPSARALYYNVSKVPYAFLDGVHYQATLANGTVSDLFKDWGQGQYDLNTLQLATADFSGTTVTTANTGGLGTINVDVHVTPTVNLPVNTVLHIAVVEDSVLAASVPPTSITTGENEFDFVLRKMIPSAVGTKFPANTFTATIPVHLGPGGKVNTTDKFTWVADKPFSNSDKYSVVLFLQDETTRAVYQAEFLKYIVPPVSTVTGIEPITADNVKVYPNPSDKEFTIVLPSPATQTTSIHLADQLGQFTEVGTFNEGEQTKTVSTQGLSAGVYILQLGNNGSAMRTKIVVVHK